MDSRNSYSRYDTHITFFMAGVCCMIINSVLDLEALGLLRFLGNSSYDAQTITFFLRRFNLLIGILVACLAIFFDVNIRCSVWHWALFFLYFLVTFYIYLLSNNVLTISKYGLAPVFTISMVSHGLLVSTVVYIFEGAHVKHDKNVALCLIIFLCGCFSSGLLVKLLLRFSGDIKDDEHLGLRFYNRLFVLFTVINLLSCFLLSRLTSMDPHYDGSSSSTNKSLHAVLFSRSRWVFFMGCVSWSFSPMFNNFTASVINSLSSMEAFNLEYMQFIICLAFSFSLYLVVITDIVVLSVGSSGARSSETLTDVICSIMNVANETNPHIAVEDGIVEDLVTNDAINIRLFRAVQPWCYLQWGFWTDWENYDCVDSLRIIAVMNINMMISQMRDGFTPVDDVGSTGVGGTSVPTDPPFPGKAGSESGARRGAKDLQSEYLSVIDAKYALTWEITCFIKQCAATLADLPAVFHVCHTRGGACDDKCAEGQCQSRDCKSHASVSGKESGCVLMCLKNCCTSKLSCLGGCLSHAFREKFVDTAAPFYPGSTVDTSPIPPEVSGDSKGSVKPATEAKPAGKPDAQTTGKPTTESAPEKPDKTDDGPTYCSVIKHKCVACDSRYFDSYRTFVYGILTACVTEAQKLLDEIGEDPDLQDSFKVSKTNELSLMAMEQYVLKFLGILVYARVADEFLLLFQQMRHIAFNTTRWVIQYLCQHKCSSDCLLEDPKAKNTPDESNDPAKSKDPKETKGSNSTPARNSSGSAPSNSGTSGSTPSLSPTSPKSTTPAASPTAPGVSSTGEATEDDPNAQKEENVQKHKCRCLLYSKFVQCVVRLHHKQIQACQVVLGMSRLSIASVLPTLSMTRSVALFSHFFGQFMFSPSIVEHSDCKCGSRSRNCSGHKVEDLEKCVLQLNETGDGLSDETHFKDNKRCGCGAYSTRVDDLLDLMIAGLGYLSEYDGILSIIIFFYSYLTDFHLDPICEINNRPKNINQSVESGPQCICCAEKGLQCDCGTEVSCKLCISCLCCPKEGKCADSDNKLPCTDCKCEKPLEMPKGCKKCCLCSIFCPKCHKECCNPTEQPPKGSENTCTPKQDENCCKICTKDCLCCSESSCSSRCCTCCYIRSNNPHTSGAGNCEITQTHTHKAKSSACGHSGEPMLLRLSENSKRNLELIAATRRTMVLQSMADYILKANFFKDMYRNLNAGLVHDKLFLLYLALCFGLYVLSVVGNVVPYVRNVAPVPKLTLLFSLASVLTAVAVLYSFLCMADFGPDSSLIINLMVLISMILCIVWSWTTQWLSYRILLYQQFESFYSKFRLVYTGGVNIYEPTLTWWFEGFVSFIKTDFHTMYLILLLKDFKDNYDPYSFGFTSRLKLNYSLLRSYNTDYVNTSLKENLNDHMFQYEDFVRSMERHLLDPHNFGKDVELYDLLDYRAFQLIPKDSYHFLTDLNSFERMSYSVDMVFAAWNRNVKMTRLADRLQFLREGALKTVEELVQNEVKRNNYDRNSIRKLKHYFDFRTGVLVDLAKNCLHDLINHGSKLASIQLSTLISIYELEYSKRWATYFASAEARHAKPPQGDAPRPPRTVLEEVEYRSMSSETLLKQFKKWKRRKLRTCDEVYDGSLICKLAVNKAGDEFELLVFGNDAVDPLGSFVALISRSHASDKLDDDIEVTKYLSHVSKTRDVLELDRVKAEITNLILKDTSNYVGSLIKGYVSVCKSMVQESSMQDFIARNNEIVIGEWIRWQGQHVSSDVIELFSKFTTIESS